MNVILLRRWAEELRTEHEIEGIGFDEEDDLQSIASESKPMSLHGEIFEKEKEKEEKKKEDLEGQFVHIRELFERIYQCDDIANDIHFREFKLLEENIDVLQTLLDTAEAGNKRFQIQFCRLAAQKYE